MHKRSITYCQDWEINNIDFDIREFYYTDGIHIIIYVDTIRYYIDFSKMISNLEIAFMII